MFFKIISVLLYATSIFNGVFGGVTDGSFELDGNAVSNGGLDWANPPHVFSGIVPDPAPSSIFTGGGSKDELPISGWQYKSGSIPDKNDITNAYTTAEVINNHLVVFFGADRYAQNGDSTIGFHFFQDDVHLLPNGLFSGQHTDNDVFVIANFGSSQDIFVYKWQTDHFVQLLNEINAVCGATPNQTACATVNHEPTPSPWSYQPKTGVPNVFPVEAFFEGGVDLSYLFSGQDTPCFKSFLAVTRASSSIDAVLKDFAVGGFNLCGLEIEFLCNSGNVDTTQTIFEYHYSVLVHNTGYGRLYNLTVNYLNNTLGYPTLEAGETKNISGIFKSSVPVSDLGVASASAHISSDPASNVLSDSFNASVCPLVSPPTGISVTVSCDTVGLDSDESHFVYGFSGSVQNTGFGVVVLTSLEVSGVSVSVSGTSLSPGQSHSYNGQLASVTPVASLAVTANALDYINAVLFATGVSGTCPLLSLVPSISINKTCKASLVEIGDHLEVAVTFNGHVCNTGDLRLQNITLIDTTEGQIESSMYLGTLLQGNCVLYGSSYQPSQVGFSYSDTVSVSANATLGFGQYNATAVAQCGLCPVCA